MDDLLSAPEAARLLGVSRQSVYLWVAQGRLPELRIAGRLVFSRAAIVRLLKTRRRIALKKPGPAVKVA